MYINRYTSLSRLWHNALPLVALANVAQTEPSYIKNVAQPNRRIHASNLSATKPAGQSEHIDVVRRFFFVIL